MIIRDAIHASIEFDALEEQVLDSPQLQRLRYVKQLATEYLVFPSAQHTRLEHSVGAMHLTGQLSKRLGLEESDCRMLRLAALLHDIGHGAFSHSSEPLMLKHTGLDHEQRGIKLIADSELASMIEEAGFSFKHLKSLLLGQGQGSMLTSDLGTDRIDYLLRDAYFTGVAYSLIDADRLLNTMALHEGQMVVTEKGRLAAESMLVSRHFMFNVVYHHPTSRIANEMVAKSMELALEAGVCNIEELLSGTDYGVLYDLSRRKSVLSKRVLERELFKKSMIVDCSKDKGALDFFYSSGAAQQVSDALDEAGLAQEDFVACLPLTPKKVSAKILTDDDGVRELAQSSSLLQALEKQGRHSQFILGTDSKHEQKAARAVAKLF
jgi:HD superfamily phosphohydrolase